MGLAVAALAPGAVATALGLWGTDAQQQTYLPAFTGADVPAAALAIAEPTVLFDPFELSTTALRDGDGFVLDGVKSAVVRGADAELFVVAAQLDGTPALFLVESGADGLEVEADPSMGLRAAALSRLHLTGVRVAGGRACSATPTARPTASAYASRGSRGARSPWAPARPSSTTSRTTSTSGRPSASRSATASRWPSWSPTSPSSCRRCGC